jgi:hypothetical protein
MSRELHAMDYRKLFARPRHYAKADTDARRLFKAPTGCRVISGACPEGAVRICGSQARPKGLTC